MTQCVCLFLFEAGALKLTKRVHSPSLTCDHLFYLRLLTWRELIQYQKGESIKSSSLRMRYPPQEKKQWVEKRKHPGWNNSLYVMDWDSASLILFLSWVLLKLQGTPSRGFSCAHFIYLACNTVKASAQDSKGESSRLLSYKRQQ